MTPCPLRRRSRTRAARAALPPVRAVRAIIALSIALTLPIALPVSVTAVPEFAQPSPNPRLMQPDSLPEDELSDFTAAMDSRVPALMAELDIPGVAVALVSSGEPVWSGAYGHTRRQVTHEVGTDTIFRAESISKSVTAWGVLRLVEADLVDLDAPAQRYLEPGALPTLDGEITVRELLTHTSGLSLGTIGVRYAPDEPRPTLLEDLRAELQVERAPGTSFVYSNVGYNLLELMVEQVTGRDFTDYMDTEVLEPFAMTSSTFSWPARDDDRVASGHTSAGDPVPPYVYAARASGGLHTTVEDVARFVAAGSAQRKESNPVLSARGVDTVQATQVNRLGVYGAVADGYALGHFTEVLADGRTAVWHGGQGTGWMTHFHLVPESGDGIVILTNSQRSWPLISAVVADWAAWSGTGSVQMERIWQANVVLRVALVGWGLSLLVVAAVLAAQVRSGARRFHPFSSDARPRRLIQSLAAVAALGALAWAASRPYLMVSSLFPNLVGWLAASVVATALLALGGAGLPPRVRRPSCAARRRRAEV